MASVNAVIRVNIDASAANAGLQQMAAQMSRFNKGMVQGSASMAAAQVAAANRAQGALNRTGQWMASTGSVMTAAGRMHKQFDKGTMASWQQWRDTSKKNNLVNQMAAQRVRALQTQYVALGREVDGAQRVMKAQPTGMLRQWGAEAEFAHQKAVLLNRRMTMGANSMINWGKNTQWAGRQMMVGMGIPLGIAAMGAVKSYKEMETAAISFKRVYGDATTSAGEKAKMLGVIQNGVGQEMTKYGIAVADTVGIAAKAAATGQQGDKLVTATRETMRLATLGQMDYDTALQSTIATQTAFGVSQKGMVRTTDFLNAAENQTVLSMEDMAKAIPRVAPVIKGLGGDVEDLAVLMTALRAGGVTAEQGANALKSGLGSLINPTSGATEAMEKFGIPLDKIVKTNKGDLIGTVQDFGKALHELPKFEQQQALEALFGKYQYARMGALFNNINKDQARETARLSKDSSANLAKISEQEMSQISDSAMNKFQGAIERLKAAAAPLGESILGGLAPLVDGLSNVIGFFANNDAARNVALFAGAFAGLAGVGVMLTGVFANFFGTMMKGYLGLKNIGRRMMGRPSLAYSGLDELEASAAQRQLAAAAEGATASLYGEKGAVNQLTAALNAMNAELRESVGLKAAATGGVPASGAGRRTATSTAAAASAAGHPAALPVGSQSGRGASVITSAQRAHMTSPSNMSQLRSFYSNSANAKGYPGGETAFKAHATGVLSGNVHNGVVLRHGYDINRQQETGLVSRADAMGDTRMRGGAMFADIMAQVNDRKFSPADYAAMDKAAETYHSELAKMPATITPEDMGRATIAAVQKDLVGSGVMTQDQWDAMQRAQTVTAPTASGVGTSRQVLPGAEGNWRTALDNTKNKSVIDAVSANTHALDADGRAVMAHAGSVDGATKATKSDTEATEKATQSKRQGLSTEKDLKAAQDKHVAATEKVSKSQASLAAATDKQRLAQDEVLQRTKERDERKLAGKPILQAEKNLAASTKRLNLANQGVVKALSGRVAATQTLVGAEQGLAKATAAHAQATATPSRGVSSPIALKGDPWGAPGKMSPSSRAAAERLTWKDPSANQRVSFPSSQRAGSGYNGLIQPGHFSNMMGSKREMLGGAMGGAWAGTKGFVGRMAGGGVFDRSPEKMDRMMGGVSNKLMGMGMAAEMVTMGLMMSGKEIPIWGHMMGMGMMTLASFPGAITPLISLLANPVTAGVAAVAAAAGGLVLAYNYAEEQSRDAGIAQGNFAVAGGQALKAMEESTGQESLYTKAMNRKVAQLTDSTSSDVQRASELSQSEYGKQMSQSYADAVKNGDFEAANSSLANQLSTGVLQKVLTIGEARAMSDSLIGGVNGQDVRTQMDSMIGKKGQLLDQNPYDFASQSMRQSQTALKAAMSDVQETAEQGIDWGKVWNELANNDQASNERSALDEILSPNMDNAKAEGAASSIWTNSAQAAYQNKLAAEERIRMAVEARAAAEKKIADLKKADPDGYKQGKEYKDAQKAYDNADRTVTRGRNSRGDYDAGLANLNTLGHNQVKGMTGDPLNQFVATGYDSLEALYSQEPGKLAALNSDRQTLDAQAANLMGRGLLTGDEAQLGQAAYQNFVNTGMAPGGMQDYTQLASQAGLTDEQAFKQMETLWGNGIGGEALSTAQQNFNNPNLKLGKAAEGTMAAQVINAKDAATLDKYNSNLQSLTDLGPKMQAAVKDAYGPENLLGKNPEDIKSVVDWAKKSGNGANNFNPNKFGPAPEVPFEGNRGNQGQGKQGGGYRPGDRSYSTSGDRGGPTSTRPDPNQSTTIPDHSPERNAPFADFFGNAADNMWPDYLGQSPSARADERTSIKAVPESIAKPGYKGPTIIPTGKSAAIKPDLGAATAAGKAEGQARGTAMASTVLQKAKASGQPMQAVAKQAGTQQGKIQGQAIGAGIGSSLGKTKSQAGRALSSIGKAGKQGQIQLKVNDAGATAKINKVKSAMGKLKGGKGGDIKLKATDNASSKIQKVTSKAKQLKNAKTDIKIKASDNASAKLTKVKAKANALKNAKANIPIKAQDNASPKLSEVKSKAANLQGLNVNIPIKATDNASAPANQAKTAITAVGQLAPNPTINANAAPAIVGAAMATAAIAAIPSSKTVTINVVKTGAIAGGGLIDSVYLAGGGEPLVRGNFSGRRVSGPGGPTDDKVPAWLSAGEFVMRQKAVNKYGSTFMSRVNSGSIDPKSVLHLKDGSGNDNSKKKGSDDSGGKEDKDTGWKDWTKEVKKLSKSWDKASKLAVKMKVSNPLLASLFGTGSPNAIGKFNPKKSKQIKKQFKKKQLMESLQATFDTLSENEKMAKAAQARVKLLKKHKGLSEDINRLEADELLAIKKSKNSKAVLKKVMKARNAASDAMFAQEWQSFADESTQSQALNAKRVELANSQKNPEYKKLMLQLTDEEVKQYNATKPGKREQFLIRRRKAMLAQEAFEKEVAKEERLSDLRGQKDFSNRFSNKEFQSLAIESPAAAAGMTEEDYEILQSLSGNELEKFRKALIEAADAANKTSRATELLNKKAEYAAMTLGQQFQEGTELLNQKSQAMRDEQAAIGEQKIVEATGKTRNQLEAEIGTRGVEVSRFQHQQELEQRHMDDINEKYNEQAKLLDDISQAQQIISSLQRGRLSVASALSSGDIAAAAAAAQEQRASEAQASIDMMKSALEKERDDRLKEHQDRIDEAQDSIDTLNDQIFEYQHAMDSIAATYALIGADTSVNIDKLNTSLQAQSGYWAAVTEDIDEYINALKEVNPNVLKLPEPSQTTPTTPSAPGGDNNNNNNNNNNNTTPPPLTPKQTKAVKIADRVEKKAMKAMDKAQDAKKAAKKTKTKKDDRQAKKATNKAEKIEGLADKADKVALTGNVDKVKKLNKNAGQKLENVNKKVDSVNVVAAKANSKDANKKVDSLQDKLKAAKEEDDKKKSKALAEKLQKAKDDAEKAENAKQQAQAAAKKKADDDEKARQKKKKDDEDNRKKQSQEAEKQRKKKEEDNKKAQAQNKNKKNNGGFITKKYASGGFVGGIGNTDKVPALLTPGEFVMTKGSAARYGKALERVNSPSYKFASNAAGYSGGSAMGTSIYNLTVNAQTNADANDIATITIKRIQDMERTRIRERKV